MAGVNKVILVGNLGRDPEVRTFPEGGSVCNVTLATSRRWKARDSNDWQEEVEWHRLQFSGRLAEVAGEYLRKGHPIYVEGRLRTRKWQDKEGRDQYATEVVVEQMQMLAKREQEERQAAPPRSAAQPHRQPTGFADDDIPF